MADINVTAIGTATARAMRNMVWTSASTGYLFYITGGGTLAYRKTTDGGATWGNAEVVFSIVTTLIAFDVWYDKWTPGDSGTRIHHWFYDSTNDLVLYQYLDTSNDTVSTYVTAFTGASAVADRSSFVTGCKARNGYLWCGFQIDRGTEKGLVVSTNGGASWSSNLNTGFALQNDTCMLFPDCVDLSSDVVYLQAISTSNYIILRSFHYSGGQGANGGQIAFTPNATDLTGQYGFSATLRASDGHIILVACNERDTATADMVVAEAAAGAGQLWTSKTNITTNIDDNYYPAVYLAPNGDIYVAYNGKRDGSEVLGTTTKVYYTKSTDGGTTWSAGDTEYMQGAAAAVLQTWSAPMGPRFYVGWRQASTNLYSNAVNSLDLSGPITIEADGNATGTSTAQADGQDANPIVSVEANTQGTSTAASDGSAVWAVFHVATALPSQVAGLSAWYKIDSLSLADNDQCNAWNDSSSNAYNLQYNGPPGGPIYKTNQVNGLATLRWDGTEYWLVHVAHWVAPTQPITVFFVARQNSKGVAARLWQGGGSGAHEIAFGTNGELGISAGTYVWDALDHSGAFHVFTVELNGASSNTWVDGVQVITNANAGTNFLGWLILQSTQLYDLSELAFFSGVLLSPADRKAIESGLGGKYGLFEVFDGVGTATGHGAAIVGTTTGGNLLTNLISYWKLDEASGTRIDSVGGNNLTDNNTVTSATGKINNAANFVRANTEYLSHASNASLQTGDIDFTVAGWINLTSKQNPEHFVTKRHNGLNTIEYDTYYNNNAFSFFVSPDGTGASIVAVDATSFGSPSTGTWYFYVAWHDSVNNTINIQINNGAVDSVAHSLGVFSGGAEFEIGATDGNFESLDGLADEVGFWKRVLTSQERTQLYNGGAGRAYEQFSGCAGTSATNFVGATIAPTEGSVTATSTASADGEDAATVGLQEREVTTAGTSTAQVDSGADAKVDASTTGTSTAAADGQNANNVIEADGSSAGTSATNVVGAAISESSFTLPSTSATSYNTAWFHAQAVTLDNTSTAAFDASWFDGRSLTLDNTSATSWEAAWFHARTLALDNTSTTTYIGALLFACAVALDNTSTASATSGADAWVIGSVVGTSTANADGENIASPYREVDANAVGSGTATANSGATCGIAASTTCTSTATADSLTRARIAVDGQSTGLGTLLGEACALRASFWSIPCLTTATGVSGAIAGTLCAIAGTSVVDGDGMDAASAETWQFYAGQVTGSVFSVTSSVSAITSEESNSGLEISPQTTESDLEIYLAELV